MNSPSDWTASALFSPSKARAQQAQAKDWAYVEAWLAKKYSKRVPTFERNEETLNALLSLATLNDGADEQRALVENVEKAALQASAKQVQGHDEHYLRLLDGLSSDGQEALYALAQSAVLLGTDAIDQVAQRICSLTTEHFELVQQARQADQQLTSMKREQGRLTGLLQGLEQDALGASDDPPEQTAEWTRSARALRAKILEYDERLATLRSAPSPSPSIEDVVHQIEVLNVHRKQLDKLSAELSAFDSLPSDARAAKVRVEDTRAQLRALTMKRDALFQGLANVR